MSGETPLAGWARALNSAYEAFRMSVSPVNGPPEVVMFPDASVDEVMALYGQEGYRRLERQALERVVATSDSVVLAVAGGIVSEPTTFAFLLKHFHTIWLKAPPETHMRRVAEQGDHRPMTGNPKAMDDLKSILTSREALYAQAEAAVDTEARTVEESVKELVEAVRRLAVA